MSTATMVRPRRRRTARYASQASWFSHCVPAAVLAFWVGGLWDRFRDSPWVRITRRGLLPVTVGLALAGGYVLATPHGLDWRYAAIAGASAAAIVGTKLNPLWLLAAGGALGALLL